MNVYNPTDSEITIVIEGRVWSVGPKVSALVPSDVAGKWIKVHGFLQIVDEAVAPKPVEVVESTEPVEAAEEKVEEVAEEPKKKAVKKK